MHNYEHAFVSNCIDESNYNFKTFKFCEFHGFLLINRVEGDHTLSKTVKTSSQGGLARFTKKRSTCIGCKAVLDKDGEAN